MATQNDSIAGSGYGNPYIDSLIGGCAWSGTSISYSFRSGNGSLYPLYPESYSAYYGSEWIQTEQDAFALAFSEYSAVCNLTFTQNSVNDPNANIGLWSVDDATMSELSSPGTLTLGIFFPPNGTFLQIPGGFNWEAPGWFNFSPGSYSLSTIIHELGHALGLAHPHDGGSETDKTLFPGVTSSSSLGTNNLNQGIFTIMSYNDGWIVQPSTVGYVDYGNASTPMALDIAALQVLYGANTSYHTGNDSYVLPTSNTVGTGWSCIWDAGGIDTINGSSTTGGCEILLIAAPLTGEAAGGYVSYMNGIVGGFTIANNVVIENAIGGSGNDIIYGNSSNNVLQGGGGDDIITCGDGTGDICGYYYSRANYSITYSSGIYTVSGAEGTDTITGVEYFQFSDQLMAASSFSDTTPPTIAISSTKTALKAGETATITFTLSEVSTTFAVGDVVATGGTLSGFTGSGTTYTALFTPTASSTTSGVVSVASTTFTDAAGNSNADGADTNNRVSMTVDTIPPTVSTFSPADATTSVAIGSNIVVTFSEAIQFGTGNIEIHSGSATGTLLASYVAGNSSNLTISGSTLTINPTSDLVYSTQYFVTFASGAIKDSAGNSYAGITTYDFTTGAANLMGTASADTLTGGAGDDTITGLGGTDILNGAGGSDLYIMTAAADHTAAEINDTGVTGTDEVRFTSTVASTLTLYALDRGIETVVIGTGTASSAISTGTTALNINAALVTNALSITGNAGNNSLTGGLGNDTLTGGAGSDYFVFNTTANTSTNKDTITDFLSGADHIQFSKAIFTGLGAIGNLTSGQFYSGTAAHAAADRIIYNSASGTLYYDADGTGAVAAVQVALIGVSSHGAVGYADIQVIAQDREELLVCSQGLSIS